VHIPINFQLAPAKKMTKMPEQAINKEVPKSGCLKTNKTGKDKIR